MAFNVCALKIPHLLTGHKTALNLHRCKYDVDSERLTENKIALNLHRCRYDVDSERLTEKRLL